VVVALVGPPGSKADAEALLKKMQASLVGVHGDPDTLQADVIQTPEGWRAAVWPFSSREQAQLINATLVARGFKTKAVNF
jgi:SPOR domain